MPAAAHDGAVQMIDMSVVRACSRIQSKSRREAISPAFAFYFSASIQPRSARSPRGQIRDRRSISAQAVFLRLVLRHRVRPC